MNNKLAKEVLWEINELAHHMLMVGYVPLGSPAGDKLEHIAKISGDALKSEDEE